MLPVIGRLDVQFPSPLSFSFSRGESPKTNSWTRQKKSFLSGAESWNKHSFRSTPFSAPAERQWLNDHVQKLDADGQREILKLLLVAVIQALEKEENRVILRDRLSKLRAKRPNNRECRFENLAVSSKPIESEILGQNASKSDAGEGNVNLHGSERTQSGSLQTEQDEGLSTMRRLKVLNVHHYVHNALRASYMRAWLHSRKIEED